jgi:hypothetical protein
VGIWDVASRQEIAALQGQALFARSVALSPDGATLASGGLDTVRIWDIASRQEIAALPGHTAPILCVAFSPGGVTLASGSFDRTVRVWDVASRQGIATLHGHTSNVGSVAFSSDGARLASGSSDRTVKIWDIASRREIAGLQGHAGSVGSVVFSPDGTILASGSSDATILLWDATPWTGGGVAPPSPEGVQWDVNGDGIVNIIDLATVASAFGTSGANVAGDVNGDGVVSIIDLVTVASHFGEQTIAQVAVKLKTTPVDGLSIRPVLDGDMLRVEVRSDGIPGLYGYQFTPGLDPSSLRPIAAKESDLFRQNGASFWRQIPASDAAGAPSAIASTRLGAANGVPLPGGLTTFTFRVLQPHRVAQTTFELRDVKLVDSGGRIIASSAGVAFLLEELIVPITSELLPNYPNPFNPETWFPYRLAKSSDVAITIYDALGRVVRRLDLGDRPAGVYESRSRAAYWDGRNAAGEAVSSGTYIVELRAGRYGAIRRLLVAR